MVCLASAGEADGSACLAGDALKDAEIQETA